ncbi:N-acetylneuraminate synthase family protein [Brucepastera parasyntrophica]|uniref:N-acetylneuraminate synthase family protein n=1 Tax=Brucepastera parasyntrophica TaxID=2880008 RepID=UPI00210B9E34|nr:N-acetylneuraminate synthase family protein [Brucepastera parasyntrophica]ULQ59880.1 N-acetylneuraminate synthase family protein [Brucepastera parasyntrophica]
MNRAVYIIGEIGQNHNGSVDIAKLLIELASRPINMGSYSGEVHGIDAVKLTKRDLDEELSASQMNMPYNNPNSFGRTYGEHRAYLELSDEEHYEVYTFAKEKKLDFVETLCAKRCLSLLKLFIPDKLKIASRDLTNLPLIESLAETKIPIILSTGMGDKTDLDNALNVITKYHNDISILHCVSQYPTEPQNLNLLSISYLRNHYSQYVIGFSDHTIGISAPVAAIALGAKIVEKHITIDRDMKGTDQKGSLGPDGVNRMIRDIRLTEMEMGTEDLFIDPSVNNAKEKLERSIASIRDLHIGEVISDEDIHLLSPGTGVRWIERNKIIGRKVKSEIKKDEIIFIENVE